MGCSSSTHLTHCDLPHTNTYLHNSLHSFDRKFVTKDSLSIPLKLIQVDQSPAVESNTYQPGIFQPSFCNWDIYSSTQISLQKLVEEIPKLTRLSQGDGVRFLTADSGLCRQLPTDGNNNSNRSRSTQQRLVGRRWSEPVHVYSSRRNPLFFTKVLTMDGGSKRSSTTSGKSEKISIGPMNICKQQVKMLLVFAKEDSQCQAVWSAGTQLGYTCELAQTSEKALELFLQKQHHLVVIDRRQIRSFDGDALCRLIRSSTNSEFTIIAAIVRRRNQIDDFPSTKDLLATGFNRILTETNRVEELHDELLQLDCGEVLSQYKLRTYQVVFMALERSSDAIQITNENHVIEYVNHAYEALTGYTSDQVIGHELSEFIQNETNEEDMWDSIREHICKGKEWEGEFFTKRLEDEDIRRRVTICPIVGNNGAVRYYVLVNKQPLTPAAAAPDLSVYRRRNSLEFRRNSVPAEQLQLRRLSASSSLEGGDASHRRTNSLAKIHSMTIEAPITQIINLISIVKENSQHQVSETLDQILDILRNSELYSPADLPSKSNDHMVSDFVEGLVTGTGYSHRRSSGNEAMLGKMASSGMLLKQSSSQAQHATASNTNFLPPEVASCFEHDTSWKYDILRLEDVSQNKPLVYLGSRILQEFGACELLQCSEDTLRAWLAGIETRYHSENPYHNSTHAADVLHATAYFLRKERVKEWMEPLDEIAALIAAIIHDVDHPGYTNAFLVNSRNPLALLYNDTAVLESHHAAYAFKFTVNDDGHNIFKGLSRDDFMTLRQSVIDMVLATELSKHFEHVNKFISIVTKSSNGSPPAELSPGHGDTASDNPRYSAAGQNSLLHHEMLVLIKRVMIKMADVSNPARPRMLCVEWARRISEEYFSQTDEEKSLGLPVVMPHFDRATCQFPKSQITFIDYFLTDMFEAWHEFCNISELMEHLNDNYNYWRMLLDKGLMSLSELEDISTGKMKKKDEKLENPATLVTVNSEDARACGRSLEKQDASRLGSQDSHSPAGNSINANNSNNNTFITHNPDIGKNKDKNLKRLLNQDESKNISIRVELPQSSSTSGDGEAHQIVRSDKMVMENHLDADVPAILHPTSKVNEKRHSAPRKHLTFKDPGS